MIACFAGFGTPTARAADAPVPRTVSHVAKSVKDAGEAIARQTGIPIDLTAIEATKACDLRWEKAPFWTAVEELAVAAGARVDVAEGNKGIVLKPAAVRSPVAVSGPFRVAAKSVHSRLDLESGTASYELSFDVNWEPGWKVYRINAYPTILKASDDRGTAITAPAANVRTAVSGDIASLSARLKGLTRGSKSIAMMQCEVTATVADRMLAFELSPDETKKEAGVSATYTLTPRGKGWLLELNLDYGGPLPVFESFENWMGGNTAELVGGGKGVPLAESEILVLGDGKYKVRYRVENIDAIQKRKLVYVTPSALREVTIPFTLKNVPLP